MSTSPSRPVLTSPQSLDESERVREAKNAAIPRVLKSGGSRRARQVFARTPLQHSPRQDTWHPLIANCAHRKAGTLSARIARAVA